MMKKPLQIIVPTSINYQKPKPGGTETYIRNLVKSMIKYDVQFTLLCIGVKRRTYFNGKLRVLPISQGARHDLFFIIKMLFKKWFGSIRLPVNALIIANGEHYCLPFLIFTKKHKIVYTAHGAALPTLQTKKGRLYLWFYERLVEKFVIKNVDKIIAVNEDAKRYYLEKYPFLSDKIIKIPVGVDITLFKPLDPIESRSKYGFKAEDKVIIYVGRLAKEKRLDLLLVSFRNIGKQVNAKLLLVGSGPEEQALRKIASQLKLKNVIFYGPKSHEEIPEIMNCADLLALCSDFEEMPTVVIEALACGVPVVATDVGDVDKVVNNKTGCLVKDTNPETIGDAILKVIRNGRDSYKDDCIAVAKSYSWENISRKIWKVYMEVFKDRGIK